MIDDHQAELARIDGTSFRVALRRLRHAFGDRLQPVGPSQPLERLGSSSEPPAIIPVQTLEHGSRPVQIESNAESRIAAFLDGVQRTQSVAHIDGVPILHATVAAVIRHRIDRRLSTWDDARVESALYAPHALVGDSVWASLVAAEIRVIDACAPNGDELPLHPIAIRERIVQMVGVSRDQIERELATTWCEREKRRWLWIDGGISGNVALDEHSCAFGVVKSHTNLYGNPAFVRMVLTLRAGERSPTFLIEHQRRRAVASWYLRLRDAVGGDPLFGLVRVELAPPVDSIADRASELSAWILAERAPLSLPDPRWDALTYGVHDCEVYLKSLLGA